LFATDHWVSGQGNRLHHAATKDIDKEIDDMRELTMNELSVIAGGEGQCTPENTGNNYGGVSSPSDVGPDLIGIYEGLVQAASHVIERVANAI